MKNLALISARSGSKGIKNKNIRMLKGKPLLAYSIEVAIESGLFDEIFVSTDSEQYAQIAMEWGASVPFLRDSSLATDTASSWDVIKETFRQYIKRNKFFDTVTLLQPTSPLRTAQDIKEGFYVMETKNADAVISVCEVDHSPLWCNTLPPDASLSHFIHPDSLMPRQNLPTYYRINGALYIVKTEFLMKSDNIYGDKCFATIMPKHNSVDIDDELDFKLAEILMSAKKRRKST